MSKIRSFIYDHGLFISWAVALIATTGSLYFSEVVGYIPCELCWYQRIIMYPLVILLLIAVIKKDIHISKYILCLSIIGALISLYHYLIQKTNLFGGASDSCGLIPCNTTYINWFGFFTIPFLALIAFLIIAIIHFQLWKMTREPK